VQLVVADANVLLAGLIDPDSIYRKLLTVFGYGKLHADLRSAEQYRAEIEQLIAEHPGARLGGQPDPDEVVRLAQERIALLDEHLPAMTPDDWGLVTSHAITKEVYDVCVGGRSGFGPLPESSARSAVAAAVAISATQVIHGLDGPIPAYTEGRDVDDDKVIHTAILAGAEWVLSEDHRHVSLERRRPTHYREPVTARETGAIGVGYFINRLLCTGASLRQRGATRHRRRVAESGAAPDSAESLSGPAGAAAWTASVAGGLDMRTGRAVAAVVTAAVALAGCGGSTKTVTAGTTSTSSNLVGPSGVVLQSVASCLKTAGGHVSGPKAVSQGSGVFAFLPDFVEAGVLKAPDAATATEVKNQFSTSSGYQYESLKNDPTVLVIYKGTLTSADQSLLSKCTG
jgi:predicted nucleic acid-binding protein